MRHLVVVLLLALSSSCSTDDTRPSPRQPPTIVAQTPAPPPQPTPAEVEKQRALQEQLEELAKQLDDEDAQLRVLGKDPDVATATRKKHEIETYQAETRRKIASTQACLKSPLGCP